MPVSQKRLQYKSSPRFSRLSGSHLKALRGAGLFVLLALSACATPIRRPCEFTLKVRVLDAYNADFECRRLGVKNDDNGNLIKDTAFVRGCAPAGMIVSNGTQDNLGHKLQHAVERNCK